METPIKLYKDVEFSIIINIEAKLETSDHDGYCSGEENDYECTINNYLVELPKNIIVNEEDLTPKKLLDINYNWESLLPEPNLHGDSFYCYISDESKKHGLGCHDYRYTIISVKIDKIIERKINNNC